MTKKLLLLSVLSFLYFFTGFAQDDEEINIIRNQFSKINKGVGYTQSTPHLADDDCRFTIEIKKKGDEIRMIELRRIEDTRGYTYQYYYWDGEPFFVYTQNDINEGENEDGVLTFRHYEYRHYFSGYQCIRSLYRGFRYTDKEPNVKSIEFMDYFKAYDERDRAEKLLDYAEKGLWNKICEMNIPI